MASRSDALIRFREAVDVGDADGTLQAARDRGDLTDSLALLLVLPGDGDGDPDRYDRAVTRWLVRLQETVALRWEDRERCARSLAALAQGASPGDALDALRAVLVAYGQGGAADEVDSFRDRQR